MKLLLYYTVPAILIILLVVLPRTYCIRSGSFRAGFWFTWWTWAIVLFAWGLSIPKYYKLVEEVTGRQIDAESMVAGMGIILGWLPGLVFSSIGVFFSRFIFKKPEDIVYNKNSRTESSEV